MTKKIEKIVFFAIIVAMLLVSACAGTQQRVEDADAVVQVPDKVNYFQRQQIAEAEKINDDPFRVFFWYIMTSDGNLISSFTCIGRPASSTESMEPNNIYSKSWLDRGFKVPLEAENNVYTQEAMGLDGTFGEEVPYRFCITPEGEYVDISMFTSTMVSTRPLTFPDRRAAFDQELEAKKLLAEQALSEGKCIDSALNVVTCTGDAPVYQSIAPVIPDVIPPTPVSGGGE